ncbi:MFS transporter [Streptomyces xanthochromogenes]|uniref:MFS transporter n=1 Tax=Streptomyces xanthochromogenes TaxID=67384 RepID=UPI00198CD383|nr:MFS transporter [Streptomyces xanthochromogenes]GHB72259.1 MFS transporter [Streptomyces xanthochromogenes]
MNDDASRAAKTGNGRLRAQATRDEGTTAPDSKLRHNADFIRLWSGQSVSMVGTVVSQLALPLVSVTVLGATPSQLGLISAIQLIPILVIGPALGHLVDALPRRPLLIWANISRCAVLAVVATLIWWGSLQIWNLALCALAMGALAAVFDIAWYAYFPSVVPQRDLVPANARMQASYSVAQVGGSGLGGLLLKVATPALAFLFDMATFLFAAIAFARIRTPERRQPRADHGEPFWPKFTFGFRVLFRDKVLRAMLMEGAWFNLCEQAFLTVFMVFAVRELGIPTDIIGVCIGLGSIGAVAGSFAATGAGKRLGPVGVLVIAMGLASFGPSLVPLATGNNLWSAALIVASFCFYGFGLTIYNTHSIAQRQLRVDSTAIGRASAAFRTIAMGALPLGAAAGGALADIIGYRSTLFLIALLLIGAWIPFSLTVSKEM